MPSKSPRVTAVQVARRSGVSQATVSYVLNDNPTQTISTDTRERVLRAVADLGYTPYQPARTLRSGKSNIVLFIAPDFPLGHVTLRLFDRLGELLQTQGRVLLTHRPTSAVPVREVVRSLAPFAVLSMSPLATDDRAALDEMGVLVEAIGFRERTGANDPDVVHPQERVGALQADYLIARGHRRIGYAMPDDQSAAIVLTPRLEAVRAACIRAGLREPAVATVALDPVLAGRAVHAWMAAEVTAVCAYTDDVAMAVIAGAHAVGVDVPGQLAVIGVDDTPLAAVSVPALTTVHLNIEASARKIARPLGLLVDDGEPEGNPEWEWIIERSSA